MPDLSSATDEELNAELSRRSLLASHAALAGILRGDASQGHVKVRISAQNSKLYPVLHGDYEGCHLPPETINYIESFRKEVTDKVTVWALTFPETLEALRR